MKDEHDRDAQDEPDPAVVGDVSVEQLVLAKRTVQDELPGQDEDSEGQERVSDLAPVVGGSRPSRLDLRLEASLPSPLIEDERGEAGDQEVAGGEEAVAEGSVLPVQKTEEAIIHP